MGLCICLSSSNIDGVDSSNEISYDNNLKNSLSITKKTISNINIMDRNNTISKYKHTKKSNKNLSNENIKLHTNNVFIDNPTYENSIKVISGNNEFPKIDQDIIYLKKKSIEYDNTETENFSENTGSNNANNSKNSSSKNIKFDKSNFINTKFKNLFEDYNVLERLGQGGFGSVYKIINKKNKNIRACKLIKKQTEDDLSFFNEFKILKTIDHPNIIKLYELYSDSKFYYLVEELCEGGDLYSYIKNKKNFTEHYAAYIIYQILLAVNHLHSKKIVHRDLKPENIVLSNKTISKMDFNRKINEDAAFSKFKTEDLSMSSSDNIIGNNSFSAKKLKNYNTSDLNINKYSDVSIKIIDFGTSTYIKGKKLTKELGTIYYIAPEVLKGEYDEKCDIWSIGVICFFLLSGHPPFKGKTEEEIKQKILNYEVDFINKDWKKVSKNALKFVTKLLKYNYSERPNASECLNDEWIKDCLFKHNSNNGKSISINDLAFNKNLEKFHSNLTIQKIVLSFITNQLDEKNDAINIKEEFQKIDTNNDGVISKEELIECLAAHYNLVEANIKAEEIMNKADFNNDGTISFQEFTTISADLENIISNENLKIAFDMFDIDGNGYITKDEFESIIPDTIKDYWEQMIQDIDDNKDGKIDYNEFITMMNKFINIT